MIKVGRKESGNKTRERNREERVRERDKRTKHAY
jgi:hypothetical protein